MGGWPLASSFAPLTNSYSRFTLCRAGEAVEDIAEHRSLTTMPTPRDKTLTFLTTQ